MNPRPGSHRKHCFIVQQHHKTRLRPKLITDGNLWLDSYVTLEAAIINVERAFSQYRHNFYHPMQSFICVLRKVTARGGLITFG